MKKHKIAVVMPSYNESENIKTIIKRIIEKLPDSKIIIVDDSSEIENVKIRKITNKFKNVILISRMKKLGRGSAIILGFKKALSDSKVTHVFEMDSDLAHDPKEFHRFLQKINQDDFDLVIGSRYVKGGKIKNIPYYRTLMSRFINFYLFFWLAMRISDFTSGFRLYSRRSVEFLVKTKLESTGFITLSEVLYKLGKKGFKITEVPITWNYRRHGKSNVNLFELYSSFSFVVKMRLKDVF